ncbi:FAD/NAD(P)-binding protein [Streptomyces sp. NPDC047108]|uniref:FAD/NAD(P)-binding protein n=1 Tax=Streptomyces sp. NPDC047108 TaxID=3155025 RepID=UPI0033DC7338
MEELAVIGGGAYAAVFLNILTERLAGTGMMPRITVFDSSRSPWTGEAFGEDTAPGLTNSPAAWMSASVADPLHYVRWLHENHGTTDADGEPVGADTVVPRPVYGQYLREVMAMTAERAAREGGALLRVQEGITGVSGEGGALRLRGAGGDHGPYARVLVCVGPGGRLDPYGLSGTPGYCHHPYPLGELAGRTPSGAPALVIGTGLTAVDVALSLLDRAGTVTLASRTGLLPMPRVTLGEAPPLVHLTRHRIDEAIRESRADGALLSRITALVDAELRENGTTLTTVLPDLVPREDAATRLRKALANPQGHPWQPALVHAAADHFAYAFHHLPDDEKLSVVTGMHPYLRNFGVPIPRRSAERLLAALDAGALRVLPGLTSVRAVPGGFEAETAEGTVTAPVAVNATNSPAESWQGEAADLIGSLVAGGYAQVSPYGGLRTDLDNQLLDAGGRPRPDLAGLGPVTRGSHYLIDAVVLTLRHAVRLLDRWYPA